MKMTDYIKGSAWSQQTWQSLTSVIRVLSKGLVFFHHAFNSIYV